MMASKKAPGSGGRRTARRGAQKTGIGKYVAIIAVLVVVVVVAVVLLSSGNKQPARTKADTEEVTSRRRTKRKSPGRSARTAVSSRESRREERRREREQRRARRQSQSRTSSRTTRYGRSGRSRSQSGVIQAIMTDGAGQRFALIDNRRLKTGDEVAGRRLVDIGSNTVKVEYKGASYSVKIGQPLY